MNRKSLLGISAAALLSLGLVACGGSSSSTASGGSTYPGNGNADAGKTLFLGSAGCVACHTVAGTAAAGTNGPNLSKVGSALTADQIYTQLVDPSQRPAPYAKAPGSVQMPKNSLTAQQRADITAWLVTLK